MSEPALPSFPGNRVTEWLGISYPIIQAGMVWCSGWELASAVSNAGGLGIIGSGSMEPEVLRIHIRKCKAATGKPFAVNIPLLYRHIEGNVKVILEEGVPVVFSSAGNPRTWTQQFKAAGTKVAHVVSSTRFALKAQDAGVDAVVAEGFEAGGHNGREELTTMVLVPQVVAAVDLPVIAAGGIATGAQMAAVFALGADAVQVGTRFVACAESSAHQAFKQLVASAPEDGTQLTLKEISPVRLLKNHFWRQVSDAYGRGATVEELSTLLGRGRARRGMFEGDVEEGELEIGQVSGMIRDILPASQIVKQLLLEYMEAKRRLP